MRALLGLTLLFACGDKNEGKAGDDTAGSDNGGGDTAADTAADSGQDSSQDTDGDAGLTGGDGYGIVYAAGAGIGIDGRAPVNTTFDGDGALIGYTWSATEAPTSGDCLRVDLHTSGGVAVGTWSDGTLGGEFYGGSFTFPAEDGFHYGVAAAPQTAGTLGRDGSYTLDFATPGTISDASLSPGTVTASAVVAAGETPLIALMITVDQGGQTMTLTTPGYPDPTGAGTTVWEGQFSGPMTVSGGPLCGGGGCYGYLRGMLADDGERMVFAWQAAAAERVGGVVLLVHE